MRIGISRSAAAPLAGLTRTASARRPLSGEARTPVACRYDVGNHRIHWRRGEVYPPGLSAHQRRDVERARQRLIEVGDRLGCARKDVDRARADLRAVVEAARRAEIPDRRIAKVAGLARDTVGDLVR